MATFIKIGNDIVNLDHVVRIHCETKTDACGEPYMSHTIETVATAASHLNKEEYEKLIQITNPI